MPRCTLRPLACHNDSGGEFRSPSLPNRMRSWAVAQDQVSHHDRMPPTPDIAWNEMPVAWRQAFTEAWSSFCSGSLGIGAVLVDPETASVVAVGRNRVNESAAEPRTLSGNFMAHAEMNAFAALTRFKADGLHLYTTLQPCLMCAASAVFLHVERVLYAAADEYFEGVHDLWDHHSYSRQWKPAEVGPLDPPISSFARILPLTVQASVSPDSSVMRLAHQRTPDVAALAVELAGDRTLDEIRHAGGQVSDVLSELWARLPS